MPSLGFLVNRPRVHERETPNLIGSGMKQAPSKALIFG